MKLKTEYIPFMQRFACLILVLTWFASLFFHGNYDFLYGFLIASFWFSISFFQYYSFSIDILAQYKKPIPIAVIAFTVLCIFSAVTSTVPYTSIYFLYIFLMCPVLFLTFIHYELASVVLPKIILMILFIVIGVACWAIFQFVFLQDIMGPRIHHPMANPNSLALLFNVEIIVTCGMILLFKDVLRRFLLFLSLIVLTFALMTTQSKGGVLILAICLSGFFICTSFSWKNIFVHIRLCIASFVIILFSGVTVFLHISDFQLGSLKTRFSLWGGSFEMFQDNPWLGLGYSTFYLHYPQYRYESDVYSAGFFAHMDPLQFAIELGVFAPVLFYFIGLCFVVRTFRAVKGTQFSELQSIKILTLFWSSASVFVHSHLSFPFYLMPILTLTGLLLACLYVETSCKALSQKVALS